MKPYQEIIEEYLSGRQSEAGQKAFEKRLNTEPELKAALELEVAARQAVRAAGRRNLKSRLEQFESTREAKLVRPLFNARRLLLIASLLVGVFSAYWLFQTRVDISQPDYFAEYFEPYRSPANERGQEEREKNTWDAARDFYRHGKYEQAVMALQAAIPKQYAPEYLMQFYLGVSLLAQPDPRPEAAITALEKVLPTNNNYRQQARWYLALAYLRLGEHSKAVELLRELEKTNDFKRKEVGEVLVRIQNE